MGLYDFLVLHIYYKYNKIYKHIKPNVFVFDKHIYTHILCNFNIYQVLLSAT